MIERNWPSSFDPYKHGEWGRLVNFHNVQNDVGWDTGNGVSALALDWVAAPAPQLTLEYLDGGKPHYLPTPTRDTFHTYVVKFVAGRTDGTTVRPGALTVWADGADTPAINLQQINTLQRYNGVTQKWMQLWEGDYTRGLQQTSTQSFVLTRIGGTLAEAIADRPIATGSNASGQFYTGNGTNLGAPTATAIASRTANQSLIPPSLGGSTTPPPTTTTPPPPTTTTPTPTPTPTPPPPTTTTTPTPPPPADTTPPSVTITAGPAASTTSTSTSFAFTANETGAALACSVDGGTFVGCASPAGYNGLAVGDHTFNVRAKDAAGNVGSASRSWSITAPSNPGASKRKQKKNGAQANVLAVSGPALLEWDGRLFHTAGAFRQHLLARGIVWSTFVDKHPAVVSALGLPSVKWDGHTFYTQASLTNWLAKAGTDYRTWAKGHPTAAAILAGKSTTAAPTRTPSRTLAAVPVVMWDHIEFTRAAGLRQYLGTKQIGWNQFLVAHPSIAHAFGLTPVHWDGRQFYTRSALAGWLTRSGSSLTSWANDHPTALARLT